MDDWRDHETNQKKEKVLDNADKRERYSKIEKETRNMIRNTKRRTEKNLASGARVILVHSWRPTKDSSQTKKKWQRNSTSTSPVSLQEIPLAISPNLRRKMFRITGEAA